MDTGSFYRGNARFSPSVADDGLGIFSSPLTTLPPSFQTPPSRDPCFQSRDSATTINTKLDQMMSLIMRQNAAVETGTHDSNDI